MTWEKEVVRTPTSIGSIFIALTDNDGEPANHIATFNIQILDQNGEYYKARTGDLQPHLTPEQTTAIINFMAEMRTKAEAELLPGD